MLSRPSMLTVIITTTLAAALNNLADIYVHVDCAAHATNTDINALEHSQHLD
jgi:hypothetical protein